MSNRTPLLSNQDDVQVGVLDETRVTIEQYGYNVSLKDSCYAKTNHFIIQSRPFFPRNKLRTYIYFRRMRWLVAFIFLVNFFSMLSFYLSLIMDGLNFIFLIIFLQHQYINCHTMRYVRMQPVISSETQLNNFYKLTVQQLNGVFLACYRAGGGAGFMALETGEVKFQVFNHRAVWYIKQAKKMSIIFLMMLLFMAGYSGTATYLRWGEWSTKEQFEIFRKRKSA